VATGQRPIELIHARNLITGLSTPALLVDEDGVVVFYNDAAGMILGRRFEESGRMAPEEWGTAFQPIDRSGKPVPVEELPLTIALRQTRPAYSRLRIRSLDAQDHEIHVSAIPILTMEGLRGAMALFWSVGEGDV